MSEDYVVGAAIGDGLMGPRYAGRYRPSGHPVALEQVPRPLSDRPEFVDRLARAGKAAHGVTKSHVVAVYDLVRLGPTLYVVTELVRARRLAALLGAERSLPLPAALTIANSVLAGLEEIHRAGLSHGDVSPDVVVITPAGGVRITELGVAAVLAADPTDPRLPRPGATRGGCAEPGRRPLRRRCPAARADQRPAPGAGRAVGGPGQPGAPGEQIAGPGTGVPLPHGRRLPAGVAGVPRQPCSEASWRVQSDLAVRVTPAPRPSGPPPAPRPHRDPRPGR